jgi:hypothetical protein
MTLPPVRLRDRELGHEYTVAYEIANASTGVS